MKTIYQEKSISTDHQQWEQIRDERIAETLLLLQEHPTEGIDISHDAFTSLSRILGKTIREYYGLSIGNDYGKSRDRSGGPSDYGSYVKNIKIPGISDYRDSTPYIIAAQDFLAHIAARMPTITQVKWRGINPFFNVCPGTQNLRHWRCEARDRGWVAVSEMEAKIAKISSELEGSIDLSSQKTALMSVQIVKGPATARLSTERSVPKAEGLTPHS